MTNQKASIHQMNNIAGARTSTNPVLVTIYEESPAKTDPICKYKPAPLSSNTGKRGYDRRSRLLAYARELREAAVQQLQCPENNARPKSRKWRFSRATKRIRSSFLRIFLRKERQWNYEPIESEEHSEVDQSYSPKWINRTNKEDCRNKSSNFCKKLKSLVRELSCGSCSATRRDG
ncbi:hypothetical protein K2173_022917 [Erythroxylum novogranatense]|uniref:Uncharacterized protein n=1 Tax=Erythroxylum novogranatense TaxID=1862640 RepID=A0AAV8T9D4_9ROSI|nr:hypothetical protein K2173_022917 [Erythroxylum novogranatense]